MTKLAEKHFIHILFTACVLYFSLEYFITHHILFCVDDFWFTHWIYKFKNQLPYRDFIPHSTVLGYYLLLPGMLNTSTTLTPLYHLKTLLALINSILFFSTGCWLTRFFNKTAVLCSILLILFSELVLTNSTHIRIDILCYWFCLISVLCLFENKFALAGFILALGFATSQKAVWYIFATNCALGIDWLVYARNWQRLRPIITFNASLLVVTIAYIAFWSHYSSLSLVLQNTFFDAYAIYKLGIYNSIRHVYWHWILSYNSLLFFVWPVTLLSLIITRTTDTTYRKRLFSIVYASCIVMCLIPYKQLFPYYTLAVIPAFLLLYAGFFSWVFELLRSNNSYKLILLNRLSVVVLLVLYVLCLARLKKMIQFPSVYLCISLIPILLVSRSYWLQKTNAALISLTVIFTGIAYPLICYSSAVWFNSGAYQKSMLTLTQQILQTGGDYLAGIELFYNKPQPIPGMRQLDMPAILYLDQPSPKLAAIMVPSLEHEKTTRRELLQNLQQASIKLYVNNYRMGLLPDYLKQYLAANFQHYWGSIYLYAPLITRGKQNITIKFSGQYLLASNTGIQLDGKNISANKFIYLTAGTHFSNANTEYRLKLTLPDMQKFLDPAYQQDNWAYMVY